MSQAQGLFISSFKQDNFVHQCAPVQIQLKIQTRHFGGLALDIGIAFNARQYTPVSIVFK